MTYLSFTKFPYLGIVVFTILSTLQTVYAQGPILI